MQRALVLSVAALAMALVAACSDNGSTADGFQSVATGDTYGEWELYAEYRDGEWTGCLKMDHYVIVEECGDPDDGLVTYESGDGAVFGAVPLGSTLVFDDGDEVPLTNGRFFVVADAAEISLAD